MHVKQIAVFFPFVAVQRLIIFLEQAGKFLPLMLEFTAYGMVYITGNLFDAFLFLTMVIQDVKPLKKRILSAGTFRLKLNEKKNRFSVS